jgi:hypothetical protein
MVRNLKGSKFDKRYIGSFLVEKVDSKSNSVMIKYKNWRKKTKQKKKTNASIFSRIWWWPHFEWKRSKWGRTKTGFSVAFKKKNWRNKPTNFKKF